MNGQDTTESINSNGRRACLVEGCTCKDARIVSTRRASYFASVAKARGETADRVIKADPSWALPVWTEPAHAAAASASADPMAVLAIRFDSGA